MIEIMLRRHGKARVWFDDRPARLAAPPVKLETFEAGGIVPSRNSAALELLVPRGGDVQYGLLGGTFCATSGAQLVICGGVDGSKLGSGYFDSLVRRLETPAVGLPDQLAEAAIVGMHDRAFAQDALVAGVLTLDCAAFGQVSSSPAHFGKLAVALVELLVMSDISPSSIRASLEALLDNEVMGHGDFREI